MVLVLARIALVLVQMRMAICLAQGPHSEAEEQASISRLGQVVRLVQTLRLNARRIVAAVDVRLKLAWRVESVRPHRKAASAQRV